MNPFRTPLDPLPKARPLRFRPQRRPDLTIEQILKWCDDFQKRFGRWPMSIDGARGLPDTTWSAINTCLHRGLRGLKPGSSLAKLLRDHRGRRHKGCLSRLTPTLILKWADDHHTHTGEWPHQDAGPVTAAPGETWCGVNAALWQGGRGLPGGSSIAQLLAAKRAVRNHMALPPLTPQQILKWVDQYHDRTGEWPHKDSGPITVLGVFGWLFVETALSKGKRGLPGGSSLPRLLKSERGVRNVADLPRLQHWEILFWADAYHERTGKWPTPKSGAIPEAEGETWSRVNTALLDGLRGLPGGDSLARFLHRRCGVPNKHSRPRLSKKQILRWADEHRRRTGEWPTRASGVIAGADGETWCAVNHVLGRGRRGLTGKSSLAQLLADARGVPNKSALPPLTHEKILKWADAHHARTGRWPTITSDPVADAPHETWLAINAALRTGNRGLPSGDSLARLLTKHRGKRNHLAQPPLTTRKILAWADAYRARVGTWPRIKSGSIPEAAGQTWAAVDMALHVGVRGLPGGDSLARLLTRARGVRNRNAPPRLSIEQIQRWVRAHYRRTGCWPKQKDGPIPNTQGETWSAVAQALSSGLRGLPGGSSLAQVVETCQSRMKH